MDWTPLLAPVRLGRGSVNPTTSNASESGGFLDVRSEFARDWDRLIFSSAFRRMQDKAQVVAGRRPDHVRTRLTHSLEVASVARSLGTAVGRWLDSRGLLRGSVVTPQDVGAMLAAASLVHDIGNPPFGHAGEDAIQRWFEGPGAGWLADVADARRLDFTKFEGNAQGLRVVSTLQHPGNRGGLQLTLPTLGAFAKYPRVAAVPDAMTTGASGKKHGVMASERALFAEAAGCMGLPQKGDGSDDAWHRHPLAFLLEAADDICYGVVDIEDGLKSGRISYEELRALHEPFLNAKDFDRAAKMPEDDDRARYLRAATINVLVRRAFDAFVERHDDIMAARFDQPILDVIEGHAEFERFKLVARDRLYDQSHPSGTPDPGEVISRLLNACCQAMHAARSSAVAAGVDDEHVKWLALQILRGQPVPEDPADALLLVTDYVAGMTDGYAIEMYRQLGTGFDADG